MKRYILTMFSIFDIFYLFIYFLNSFKDSKIPFYDDLLSLPTLLEKVGVLAAVFTIPSIILLLSLFLSAYYYCINKWNGFYLALFQLPLRIFCLLPTIPYSIYVFKSLFNLASIYSFCFLITLELSKILFLYLLFKENRSIK
ncbi:hypothetical protein SAMN05660772_02345 [Pasteurella testudinis DSM 23072]|uniref:Uncharacterized protein n=1 Tax=Pasteurella testudinis DSM 23072 TaxID=1122938 RepID=A0A1W1UUP3_9PAST|nr:hypothetical protein SAMN05660772_02345 [Pasteurella testudinis DSM 23072]SUB51268.1 Uncharacterised protein [Pasteurella testudinis]